MQRMVWVLTSLLLLVLLYGWFWLGSSSGNQWLEHQLTRSSGGELKVTGLKGHPLTHFSIQHVDVVQQDERLSVDSVVVSWSPWNLLWGELSILSVTVKDVQIEMRENRSSSAISPIGLPSWRYHLGMLRVDHLVFQKVGGDTQVLENIRVNGRIASHVMQEHMQAMVSEKPWDISVSGLPSQWRAVGTWGGHDEASLQIKLSGHALQYGDIEADMTVPPHHGVLKGAWQYGEGELKASGDWMVATALGDVRSDWHLNVGLEHSQVRLEMQSELRNTDVFHRLLAWQTHLLWEDGRPHVAAEDEQKHWLFVLEDQAEKWQADLTFKQWESPLKRAEGKLSGALHGVWSQGTEKWKLDGDIDQGELAGVQARMHLDVEGVGERWSLHEADVAVLGLQWKMKGLGDAKQLNLTGEVASNQLAPLFQFLQLQGASGQLQANWKLYGGWHALALTTQGKIWNISGQGWRGSDVTWHVKHAPDDGSYKLSAQAFLLNGETIFQRATVSATRKGQRTQGSVTSTGAWVMQANIDHDMEASEHHLSLSEAKLSHADMPWFEVKKIEALLDETQLQLTKVEALRLLDAPSSLQLTWSAQAAAMQMNIADLNLQKLSPWLGAWRDTLSGHIGVDVQLAGTLPSPIITLHITSPSLRYGSKQSDSAYDFPGVRLSRISVDMKYVHGILSWEQSATAPMQGFLKSSGQQEMTLSLWPWRWMLSEHAKGSGDLSLNFGQLSTFQPLFPRLDPLQGTGELQCHWRMPWDIRWLQAEGVVELQALGIPEFGLALQGQLKSSWVQGKPFVDLLLRGGGGELRMRGELDMDHRVVPDIELKTFPLMDLPHEQVVVSGVISASERNKVSHIQGKIDVTKMRFEISEALPTVTEDLQWEDAALKRMQRKSPLSELDVMLTLTDQAEVYGRGMQLKPKGVLHLGGSVSQPKLTGTLDVTAGKIEFRSVKLDILPDSRIVFSGDPKKPVIYVRAARKVGDVVVGVLVQGAVDQLSSQLFSQPSMSNTEIFSYIATGRPLASLGKENASDLLTASDFLLGSGTLMNEVQQGIQNITGLNLFEINANATGGNVRVGRKLMRDVMLTVDQAVSKDASTAVTLEYMLSQNISVFAKQTVNLSPHIGFRYSQEWFRAVDVKE